MVKEIWREQRSWDPKERTEGSRPFEVVAIDYAGPITFKTKKNGEGKANILLAACSLTRAVYLELLPDTTVANLILCLKRFIARRGDIRKSIQIMLKLSKPQQNG